MQTYEVTYRNNVYHTKAQSPAKAINNVRYRMNLRFADMGAFRAREVRRDAVSR